jgi:hypothetical protein
VARSKFLLTPSAKENLVEKRLIQNCAIYDGMVNEKAQKGVGVMEEV